MNDIELSKLHYLNNSKLNGYGIEFIDYVFKNKIISSFKECCNLITKNARQFNNFFNLIQLYRKFAIIDIDTYFNFYLPYKKEHPKVVNSVELCIAICRNNEEEGKNFYEKFIKPKNPYTGHGGELSPWSKDFISYKNLSDEDKNKERRKHIFCKDNPKYKEFEEYSNTTSLEYYLNKGYDGDTAKKMLKERQATFSLEKCIKKYGEEEGIKRFKERQEKWKKSLNTPENIEKLKNGRLKGLKAQNGRHYSLISQRLFNEIFNKLKNKNLKMYYATNENEEYNVFINPCKVFLLDFYVPELNKWIEFDGDYWHGEKRGNQHRDKLREEAIFNAIPNIQLKRVKERDFKNDPNKIINECVEWILS